MTTQALENFENMNAQALATVEGGGAECVLGTAGSVGEFALVGAGLGALGGPEAAAVGAAVGASYGLFRAIDSGYCS
ncbi:Blp family class II bacteriocin [Streptococcus mutans]|uniref:Blp family class II bacteriocin n=1 Tax=Streptococcus mutans TaxID=1309 RepID=UPI0038B8F1D7